MVPEEVGTAFPPTVQSVMEFKGAAGCSGIVKPFRSTPLTCSLLIAIVTNNTAVDTPPNSAWTKRLHEKLQLDQATLPPCTHPSNK